MVSIDECTTYVSVGYECVLHANIFGLKNVSGTVTCTRQDHGNVLAWVACVVAESTGSKHGKQIEWNRGSHWTVEKQSNGSHSYSILST